MAFVKVTVNEVNLPPWLQPGGGTAYVGNTNYIALCYGDPDCPANPLSFSLIAPVPSGLTIDANTGTLRWVPTIDQVGNCQVNVRLCDGGTPNYCVTNTVNIAVTTNTPYYLDIQQVTGNLFQFTISDGRADMDYVLQWATNLCSCPCQTVWQPVGQVSPDTMPFSFFYTNWSSERAVFFKVHDTPRVP